jgi:putative FmdB family regulatory protein
MPMYEYECQSCHKRFEKLQKYSDKPCTKCPTCGGVLRKLISSPAIQFKGGGFYITDYAKKSAPAEEGATKGKAQDASKDASKDEPKGKSSADDASGEKPAKNQKAETLPPDKTCSE